ncbi:hypothetical protein B484DRAFT_457572 [Ochromonadaceae sp. CCMP2298]|nr:hypothetical protein B484DRAFT_457572 [Ochromonadaceae sp. CCMP2298]
MGIGSGTGEEIRKSIGTGTGKGVRKGIGTCRVMGTGTHCYRLSIYPAPCTLHSLPPVPCTTR